MATPVDIVYQKRKWFAMAKTNEKMIIPKETGWIICKRI